MSERSIIIFHIMRKPNSKIVLLRHLFCGTFAHSFGGRSWHAVIAFSTIFYINIMTSLR
jgi:hypothetical protein